MSNARSHARAWERAFSFPARREVRRTPGISCEAVRAAAKRRSARGGTSARRTGAATSFVSFIASFGRKPTRPLARLRGLLSFATLPAQLHPACSAIRHSRSIGPCCHARRADPQSSPPHPAGKTASPGWPCRQVSAGLAPAESSQAGKERCRLGVQAQTRPAESVASPVAGQTLPDPRLSEQPKYAAHFRLSAEHRG